MSTSREASYNPLSSEVLFDTPKHLHPESAWISHTPFAMALCETLRPKCVVELGTHRGVSYLSFCQAIASLQIECKAYAVDTWNGDKHSGNYDDSVYQQLRTLHQEYEGFSSLLRMTFDEAADHLPDQSVDLLHIDGLHTYEAAKKDFLTWKCKLSNQAVVLFHDTQVYHLDFAVHQLWKELSQNYPNFEFKHGHGLGVLFVGANRSQFINSMIETASAQQDNFHNLFRLLGAATQAVCDALHPPSPPTSLKAKLKSKLTAVFGCQPHKSYTHSA